MNTRDKRVIARQARAVWNRSQRQREQARARANPRQALDPPGFHASDIVDPTDGTLNKDVIASGQGLAVQVPLWRNAAQLPGEVDVLDLEWAAGALPGEGEYLPVESLALEGPIDPATFPRTLRIPGTHLRPDGAYRLRYRVTTWNGVAATCVPVALVCDSTPPLDGADAPPPGIPAEPITDDYLETNPAGIAWTLPAYEGFQPGDQVQVWYVAPLPENPDTAPFDTLIVPPPPATLNVPREKVEATGDGGCFLAYRLVDKATNASQVSAWTRLAVALGPLPADLQLPLVPQADDGAVNLRDAATGVRVRIPRFTNAKVTDRIRLNWGGIALQDMPAAFPLDIRVPDAVLRQAYGNAEGPVDTQVSYQVLRGDLAFPEAPLGITVSVDLYLAGPELPEWPDPINPQLPPARVFGRVSDQENVLTRDDGEQDGRLLFTLYSPLKPGELVDFYWDGRRLPDATYTVQAEDEPGAEREVAIAWAAIAEAGNHPMLPVFYRIRGPGSPNEQQSPTTHVDANAFTLTAPTTVCLKLFNDILNCESLDGDDNAVLVQVPDLTEWLKEGDTVSLSWRPFAGNQFDVPLPDAVMLEDVVLDSGAGFPPTGFIWRVQPYETYCLPVFEHDPTFGNGLIHVQYTFTFENELVRSLREDRICAFRDANDPCDFDPTATRCRAARHGRTPS